MHGRPFWLPRLVACCALFVALLMSPVLAVAQLESAVSTDQPAANLPTGSGGQSARDILNLDIEQLARTPVVVPSMDIPVTSVTKEQSTVGRSAAAVFVITNEMIRRSGSRSIPEALRMAPGLDVAQVNSNAWAISSRGFNYPYADKLLVLIDGRTVYNPDLSGVFWNVQDVLLEDVDRIEVIRGPGGTLWGANAVNGVINIITKSSTDTQGGYVEAGGGSHHQEFTAFRYGGCIGDDLHYRVYGKQFEDGPNFDPEGLVDDAWRQGRVGFRADWQPDRDKSNTLTILGDHYVGTTDNSIIPIAPELPEHMTGQDLLLRWRHVYDEDSDWSIQTYYDDYLRSDLLQSQRDRTYDIELQYRFRWNDRHGITCGAGYRNVVSWLIGGDQFVDYFPTPYLTTNCTNQFIQDEITLVDDLLTLTLGTKLEQNYFTGLEYEPNVRLLWTPDRRHSAWGAVSRAVRTPSRINEPDSITFPPIEPGIYPRVIGSRGFMSEDVIAYELGYRTQATDQFSWDIATFYNMYHRLSDYTIGEPFGEPPDDPTHVIVPLYSENSSRGQSYGVELAVNYAISERWRLYAQYTYFHLQLQDNAAENSGGSDPANQVYLRSAWDLRNDLHFDLMARYVDTLELQHVPKYITMDARLGWQLRKHLELAVVGQNLLQARHYEYGGGTTASPVYATEAVRGVYGSVTWRR